MGKFAEKKAKIAEASAASNKKTFNEQQFNELGTALLNETGYTVDVIESKGGEVGTKTLTPVDDFRKVAIGGLLKAAGHDAAEAQRMTDEYQFPTLPLHGVVSEMLENYMGAGKKYAMLPKDDMRASIYIEARPEEVKDTKSPQTGVEGKVRLEAYRKLKADSTCPTHKRHKL